MSNISNIKDYKRVERVDIITMKDKILTKGYNKNYHKLLFRSLLLQLFELFLS